MTTQSEQTLEQNLLKQLQGMEYEHITIPDEATLLVNLKSQLEKHNQLTLSDAEFRKVLNHLNKGNVFDRAKILRDKMHLVRDDGSNAYIEFINSREWCQNEFQVTNQITAEGSYKNRYDVTILINGLPLVHIELKRRGLELKEAFNQVLRYHKHSFTSGYGLFMYLQIFIISNGVNTKYYANNPQQKFKQTFYWADKDNHNIIHLNEFTAVFLEKCRLAKMITKYIVTAESAKELIVMRPYQCFAVEAIFERVKNSSKNGYIWHTTGSGKTLTSFKTSQILLDIPEIHKVVFVVDRNDLDTQTIQEFNKFKEGSVDASKNTHNLVKQFTGTDKLIVTTIQKLNNAITREHHEKTMAPLRDKKIVFIFDECHRSQFGETHKKINTFFNNCQLFGFTGTPIFADNAVGNILGKRTTKDLFDECLHKYVITDAIADENVLKFAVEYIGRYREKVGSATEIDIEVEGIDTKELMESEKRLEKIVDWIVVNHDRKTYSKDFNAIFCVQSVDILIKYYELFKRKDHKLKIATIFTYGSNEEDKAANGLLNTENELQLSLGELNKHSRDKLEEYIGHYNKLFGTNFTTKDNQSFYDYYKDIATRVKNREIDILLVVNMFLTGFDSKTLNTLYVDKSLRYHGLIQAYSRTNRILNEKKSQGNIVVFRNLKKATDDAIALFSNKDAKEIIFTKSYEEYVQMFNAAILKLYELTPSPSQVDTLVGEEAELDFVTRFREVIRLRNVLITFADFTFTDAAMNEQEFEDFKSKYLDIYDKVRTDNQREKVSILDDVDFELELIRRDTINVDYIIRLLARLVDTDKEQQEQLTNNIMNIMSATPELRSKRELIQKFIQQNIPDIHESDTVEGEFQKFWRIEESEAFTKVCEEEDLDARKLRSLIDTYLFTGRKPRRDEIIETLKEKPKILERDNIIARIAKKLTSFIETFIEGV